MTNKSDKIPFLRFFLPFIAGILIQEKLMINIVIISIVFIILTIILILVVTLKITDSYRWKSIFGILVFCTLFSAGMKLSVNIIPLPMPDNLRSGCVAYIPEEKQETYKVVLGRLKERMPDGWHSVKGNVLLYIKKTEAANKLEPGDLILFWGSLRIIDSPVNPIEFDFSKYCNNLGIYWKTYLDEDSWKKLPGKKRILSLSGAELIRLKLIRFIRNKKLVNESLINSLLLGYREGLTGEQQKYFASSGAMHILAVSGMHVAIIYGALVFIAGIFTRRKSGWKLILPLPVVWFYAFITGMTPSVARSAVMISLYVISKFINRKTEEINILSASAFFMIMWQPMIIHQISFQLSFAAVAGITIVFKGLYRTLKTGIWIADQIISICCLSVAAQLFTFPLSVYYFHQFPNYFILTNLYAVPLSGIILIMGFVFLLSAFNPSVSSYIGFLLDKITGLLDILTRTTGALPLSSTGNIGISAFDVVMIYIIIMLLLFYLRTRRTLTLLLVLALVAVLIGENCQKIIRQSGNKEIIIPSIPGYTVINFISGPNNVVVSDDTNKAAISGVTCQLMNYWCTLKLDEPEFVPLRKNQTTHFREEGMLLPGSHENGIYYIQFCDIKIGIMNDEFRMHYQAKVPLHLDLLVVSFNYPVQICDLKSYFSPDIIIIERDVPEWTLQMLENECIKYNIPYHSIYRTGYFKMEL